MGHISSKETPLLIAFLLMLISFSWAQDPNRELVREGNERYLKGDYTGAEQAYSSASASKEPLLEAEFNKANTFYQQQKFEDAAKLYQQIGEGSTDAHIKSKAYHNLGNSLAQAEQYDNAINAYKQALRSDPTDEETRYNLAYAKQMLREQQKQEQQQQDQNQDQNKDQEKNDQQQNQDQQQDKDSDDQKDQSDQQKDQDGEKDEDQEKENQQQSPDENKNGEDQKQPQPKPNQMSKQDAERLLKAVEQNEKDTQKNKKKKAVKVSGKTIEKDW